MAHVFDMQMDLPQTAANTDIYRPLCDEPKQFRLLTILPGHQPSEVYCILHTASLDRDSNPAYDTISYAWGDSTHRSSVRVDGTDLDVPYNTMAALRRVRLPEDERVVWIDAICINQADVDERSAQVAVMGNIYANGRENLVFLGDVDDSVVRGVVEVLNASLQRISVAMERLSKEDREELRGGWLVPSLKNNTILAGLDYNQYRLLYSLPWFQRLWVLQEASLASQSRCLWGSSGFKLSDVLDLAFVLFDSLESFKYTDDTAEAGIYTAILMRAQITRSPLEYSANRAFSIWDLIHSARFFQATDPRDHIFAPLQLYEVRFGRIPPWMLPDYRKSVEEVLRDATKYVLVYEKGVRDRVLRDISHQSTADLEAGLPSWVVRLDRPCGVVLDQHMLYKHRSGFRKADGNSPELLLKHYREEPNILELFVQKVDSISRTTLVMPLERSRNFADMQKIVAEVAVLSGFGDELHAELLTFGKMDNFRNAEHRLQGYNHFLQHLKEYGNLPAPPLVKWEGSEGHSWPARLFWDTFREMRHRRFFRTSNGNLGWGPGLMQESDILIIAQGASVPYILRPVEAGYLFLGHAWVHNLMDGEVFELNGEWDWIRIC